MWVLALTFAEGKIKRENQPKFLSNLELGIMFFIEAQSFELKSLILAQIERWRHA